MPTGSEDVVELARESEKMMTVAELIAKLQELPQDLPAYFRCRDGDMRVHEVTVRTIEEYDYATMLIEEEFEAAVIW